MASDPAKLERFYDEYRVYVENVLRPNQEALKRILNSWRYPEEWSDGEANDGDRVPDPSPLQRRPEIRIKRPEKVVDKIARKPGDPRYRQGFAKESFEEMDDVLGARIVVYFLNQLPLIDRKLRSPDSPFEVDSADPPLSFLRPDVSARLGLGGLRDAHKDTGYASIHYNVRLRQGIANLQHRPWIEIQARTLAQDLWANIEHMVGYKPDRRTAFPVTQYFRSMGAQIQALDEQLELLSKELARHQSEVSFEDDNPLNPENLPAVLASLQIESAQHQVSYMLGILHSWEVFTVGEFLQVAKKWGDLVRNKCRAVLGRDPTAVHIVALLAILKNATTPEEASRRIEVQLEAKDWWDQIGR